MQVHLHLHAVSCTPAHHFMHMHATYMHSELAGPSSRLPSLSVWIIRLVQAQHVAVWCPQRCHLPHTRSALSHSSLTTSVCAQGDPCAVAHLPVRQVLDGPVQRGAQAQQALHGLLQLAHRERQEGRVPGARIGLPASAACGGALCTCLNVAVLPRCCKVRSDNKHYMSTTFWQRGWGQGLSGVAGGSIQDSCTCTHERYSRA